MTCKGVCPKFKAKKPLMQSRYAAGQKRCSICEIFIIWDGVNCPCCGMNLRVGPRSLKSKQILLETQLNKIIKL